ncbi:MAG: phosphate ABC transporter permease PstA [Actinobacteria bacterium]|nr:phosphate ABC transporter permease PstA [Actinomycetota bacterium]
MGKRDLLSNKETELNISRRRIMDKIFYLISVLAVIASVVVLLVFISGILFKGIFWLGWGFIAGAPSRFPEKAGIFPALVGSFWLVILTGLIVVPLGVATALYLEEYQKKSFLARIIDINISNLAGVPSIIYGLLGLFLFVRLFAFGRSILSGALTMSLVVLPIVIIASQEALKAVPQSIREASFSLGATKWQTIYHTVIPSALPGIFTGIILALARAVGETAPLMIIGALAFVVFTPRGLFDSFTVLPVQIYNWASRPQKEFQEIAAAAIIVLLIFSLALNAFAVVLRHRATKKLG